MTVNLYSFNKMNLYVPNSLIVDPDFRRNRFISLLYLLLFVEMMTFMIFYSLWAIEIIIYPYQLDYGEGFLLYFSDTFKLGQSIYKDISEYPYIPGLYPPIYAIICAIFSRVIGLSFVIGRALSFVSALLIGLFIYLIVSNSARKRIAIISSILFFSSPFVDYWTVLYRVDTLGLLFGFIGLFLILKYNKHKVLFLSIIFFLLSFYTKQSFVAAPLAAFFFLLTKNVKLALMFLCVIIISGFLIFLILNYLTDGQFYIQIITHHKSTDFSLERARAQFNYFIFNHKFLLTTAFLYSLFMLITFRFSLFFFYFLIAVPTAISVGKIGSNINYFLEPIAICAVLFGLLLNELDNWLNRYTLFNVFVISLLAIQFVPNFSFRHYLPTNEIVTNGDKISVYVKQSDGGILTEDAGFAVLNGKIPVSEPFMLTQLEKHGLWDQSQLLNDLREKSISLVIIRTNLSDIEDDNIVGVGNLTKEMVEQLKKNYKLVDHLGQFYIYKPADKTVKN